MGKSRPSCQNLSSHPNLELLWKTRRNYGSSQVGFCAVPSVLAWVTLGFAHSWVPLSSDLIEDSAIWYPPRGSGSAETGSQSLPDCRFVAEPRSEQLLRPYFFFFFDSFTEIVFTHFRYIISWMVLSILSCVTITTVNFKTFHCLKKKFESFLSHTQRPVYH